MNRLHTKLTQKYQFYNNWHQTKHHGKIHWGVFIIFTLLIFGTISRWTPISFAADISAPTTPTNLTITPISLTQINLSWMASTDNVAVAGYQVYRDGTQVATPSGISYSDMGLSSSTIYLYTVVAYDAVGNSSVQSDSVSATTFPSVSFETDATKIIPEPPFSLPSPGVMYNDPAFGTSTTRLMDAQGAGYGFVVPEYSNIQAWNADITKMFIRFESGHLIIDSKTFATLNTLSGVNGLRWSPRDPDIMYYVKGVGDHKLYKYNVVLKQETVLRDFAVRDGCFIGENTATRDANYEEMSDDGRWIAISGETAGGLVCVLAYDVIDDIVSPVYVSTQGRTSANYNWVKMSPLGDYVLVLWDQFGHTRESGLDAFERATMKFAGQVHEGTGHSDVVVDPATNTQYLVVDNANNAYDSISGRCIEKARIPDGVASGTNTCLVQMPQYHNMHISCQASKPRQSWCVVGTYSNQRDFDDGWSAFEDEIFKVYLDSTMTVPHVERISHHRSQPIPYTQNNCPTGGTYWAQDHATIKRDGNQILYGSNWRRVCDLAEVVDPFILMLNFNLPPDTIAPTIPTNLQATPISSSQINLTWSSSTDDVGVTGYKIYRGGVQIATAASTSYSDTGLQASTTYTYQVSAYDSAGNESAKSTSINATTTTDIPFTAQWIKMNPAAVGSSAYIGQEWVDAQGLPIENSWFPMIFDTKRNKTVMFGGGKGSYYYNDMWYYDYQKDQWILVEPGNNRCPNSYTWPDGRDTHGFVYDSGNDLYWAFGGTPKRHCPDLPDSMLPVQQYSAWYYDPNTRSWGYVNPNRYFAFFNPGFAYSSDHQFITVFAGNDAPDYNALWSIDTVNKQWKRLIPAFDLGSPATRGQIENAMIYDSFNKVFILFGGNLIDGSGDSYDETWVYHPDTNTWQNMKPAISPPARQMHAAVYDSKRHIMIINGGRTSTYGTTLGDTWYYDYAKNTWTQIITPVSPPSADIHAMAYDSLNDVVVWFKGGSFGTWTLKLSDVVSSSNTTPPTTPTDLATTAISSSQINLSWIASTDDVGVAGYKIYRCAGSACAPTTQIATSATNSYSDTGLTASTAYTYAISAYDAAGNESEKTMPLSATTLSSFKLSDLNQDSIVNQLDFDILKLDFNRTDKPPSDLNQDGIVDSRDLGILMSEWSK